MIFNFKILNTMLLSLAMTVSLYAPNSKDDRKYRASADTCASALALKLNQQLFAHDFEAIKAFYNNQNKQSQNLEKKLFWMATTSIVTAITHGLHHTNPYLPN
jgi:hypothetical protein